MFTQKPPPKQGTEPSQTGLVAGLRSHIKLDSTPNQILRVPRIQVGDHWSNTETQVLTSVVTVRFCYDGLIYRLTSLAMLCDNPGVNSCSGAGVLGGSGHEEVCALQQKLQTFYHSFPMQQTDVNPHAVIAMLCTTTMCTGAPLHVSHISQSAFLELFSRSPNIFL